MKKFTLITLLLMAAGLASIAHAADLRQINDDLLRAARRGKVGEVEVLLERGAYVDAHELNSSFLHCTPLYYAASCGNLALVKMLIAHHAMVNLQDPSFGHTPLMIAARYGHSNVINELLAHGARIDLKITSGSMRGSDALICAAEYGHAAAVDTLLDHNADVRTRNRDDLTALGYACISGNLECVKSLIRHGSDIKYKRWNGDTLIKLAYDRSHDRVVHLLEEIQMAQDRQSILHALLAADKFATASDPARDTDIPAFPPELIDRVLRPVIKASLAEDQR